MNEHNKKEMGSCLALEHLFYLSLEYINCYDARYVPIPFAKQELVNFDDELFTLYQELVGVLVKVDKIIHILDKLLRA